MAWNNIERRKTSREFCSTHIEMSNDIASIKTSLINIEKATTQGVTFKTAMMGSMVLIVFTIIGQAFLYGRLCEKVDRNTGIIERIIPKVGNLQDALSHTDYKTIGDKYGSPRI